MNEDICFKSGIVTVAHSDSSCNDVSTSFGKGKKHTPYRKKVEGSSVLTYSLYAAKTSSGKDGIKAIKRGLLPSDEYDKLIKRSAVYAVRLIKDKKIDVLVVPKSSSPLVMDLAKGIAARAQGITIVLDIFDKVDPSRIVINTEHPKITPDIEKSLAASLRKASQVGYFEMKKIHNPWRKFLTNTLAFKGKDDEFEGKNVLLLDDMVTSGSTLKEMKVAADNAGAKSVAILAMFKAKS